MQIGDEYKYQIKNENTWMDGDSIIYIIRDLGYNRYGTTIAVTLENSKVKKNFITEVYYFSEDGFNGNRYVKLKTAMPEKEKPKMKFKSIDGNLAVTDAGELVELLITTNKAGKTVFKTVPVEETDEDISLKDDKYCPLPKSKCDCKPIIDSYHDQRPKFWGNNFEIVPLCGVKIPKHYE